MLNLGVNVKPQTERATMQPEEAAGQIMFYAAPSVQYIAPTSLPVITAQSLVKIMRSQAPRECWTAGLPVWSWEKEERERDSQFQTQFRVRQPL